MKKVFRFVTICTIITLMFTLVACGSSSSSSDTAASQASTVQAQKDTQPTAAPEATAAPATAAPSTATSSSSKDLRIAVNDTPVKALLPDLFKAMQEEYADGKIISNVYPAARAMGNIKSGEDDGMVPYLYDPIIKDDSIIYSTENLYDTIFVLYVNKNNKDITAENAYKYKIEVHPAHSAHFNNSPESDPNSGLQKVDSGRIDGYITAMAVGDAAIKTLGLKNIKRINFKSFETKVIFANNDSGKAKEKIFSDLIAKLKANGKYQEIMKSKLNVQFVPDPN